MHRPRKGGGAPRPSEGCVLGALAAHWQESVFSLVLFHRRLYSCELICIYLYTVVITQDCITLFCQNVLCLALGTSFCYLPCGPVGTLLQDFPTFSPLLSSLLFPPLTPPSIFSLSLLSPFLFPFLPFHSSTFCCYTALRSIYILLVPVLKSASSLGCLVPFTGE